LKKYFSQKARMTEISMLCFELYLKADLFTVKPVNTKDAE
jgi:hypothetical protein